MSAEKGAIPKSANMEASFCESFGEPDYKKWTHMGSTLKTKWQTLGKYMLWPDKDSCAMKSQ